MDRDNIIRKITALLAKSEGTEFEAEAESFRAKVDELMAKHNVKFEDLTDDKLDKSTSEFQVSTDLSWMRYLVVAVAHYFGAEVAMSRTYKFLVFTVIGRDSNRITCEMMFPYIMGEVRKAAQILQLTDGKTKGAAEREIGLALAVRIGQLAPGAPAEVLQFIEDSMNATKAKSKKVKSSKSAKELAGKIGLNKQATGGNKVARLSKAN